MSDVQDKQVTVVGAGMAGLSTAWFLQQRGAQVRVLDRTAVAAGASWGNAGYLTPALTLPLPEPSVLRYGLRGLFARSSPVVVPPTPDWRLWAFLADFARHCTARHWRRTMAVFNELNRSSLQAYDELADDGVHEPTKRAEPFLAAYASPEHTHGLLEEFRKVVDVGGAVEYDVLGGAETRALEPALSERVTAGVRVHGQRFINPPAFVRSLADSVRARGGEINEGFDVAGVHDLGRDGVQVRSTAGDTLRTDAVVLANGAWLPALARPFGVRTIVQAGRGYSFSVVPETMPTHPVYFPAQRVACNPLGDRFRVTGMMEFRAADASLDHRRIQTILDAVRPLLRGVDWEAREEEWVGSRPCTADGLPLVGATSSPRVHVAGGHGMWGIVLGPLTGRLLAAAMAGEGTPDVLRRLDPLR